MPSAPPPPAPPGAGKRYWLQTLGCPKNQVDSDKLVGTLLADGLVEAHGPEDADLVVVNTCAFIGDARQESIDTILALDGARKPGAELVVTGCMAERYGSELADALPEVDAVAGFGVPVSLGRKPGGVEAALPSFDLLNLPRPASAVPWAYVKVAEGCDRACGFCAIPSFRGPQRSRSHESILAEVEGLAGGGPGGLAVQEVVLVAQDLAAFGRDQGSGERSIVRLVGEVAARVPRVRLLYLYPSDLTEGLVDGMLATGVPYFDLSLQHVSSPLLRRMRRWGDGERFLARIADIRAREPEAAFRSNFIVGYPGETEDDHDQLLRFVAEAELDWCGFFPYSEEAGTHAAGLDGAVPGGLAAERHAELAELQDAITARRRDDLVGRELDVLVDSPGVARGHREAPEIDGIVQVPDDLLPGTFHRVAVTGALGPDLDAVPVGDAVPVAGPTTVRALVARG
ncbi:MAG: MiaB/RimO family radical SAM methylthiotransferase [Actinomycetota bacterium]|nr:MiaB/RimO family radical SAM methylthiotransferase [Actinomycetota bacterium]